jgi:hypothetical protein
MYLASTTDDTEFDKVASTYKTDVVASLPDMIAKEKEPTTPKGDDPKEGDKDDDSSSSVLYVSALLAIFLVLL